MPKLLGIREVVGTGLSRDVQGYGAPSFIQRAQDVSLMGSMNNYEHAGTVERAYAPYDFGAVKESFDLGRPGVVSEIKRALISLAKDRADKISGKWPVPATEIAWQRMTVNDEWDAATVDEFTIFLGRAFHEFPVTAFSKGPFMRDSPVGPQPLAMGLELIAGSVNKDLGGQPAMPIYMTWRGGDDILRRPPNLLFAPDSNAPITPTKKFGAAFLQLPEITDAANAEDLAAIAEIDEALRKQWKLLSVTPSEVVRGGLSGTLLSLHTSREFLVRKVRTQLLESACFDKPGHTWEPTAAQCIPPKIVPPPAIVPEPKEESNVALALGVGVVAALGYVLYKSNQGGGSKKKRKRAPGSTDWTMG